MAIDSAEKRRSIAHIARRWSGAGVTPNASKDAEWRQEAGRGYPGIAASGEVPVDSAGAMSNWLRQPAGRLMR